MRIVFNVLIVILLLCTQNLTAQDQDSIRQKIKKSIDKSINRNVRPSKLKDITLATSSMFIVLSQDATVEDIFISESVEGIFDSREKIKIQLKELINELYLDKDVFSNSYFIVMMKIGSFNKENVQMSKIPENWEDLFKGIETSKLNNKSLKYCFTVSMEVGSIKN